MDKKVFQYGTALITGASSGIGEAFARRLAADGVDLVLVSRDKKRLEQLAKEVRKACGVRVEVMPADLSQPEPGEPLRSAVERLDMKVDMLINNAGFGTIGSFHRLDPTREQEMVAVNIGALVDITHAFLPAMLERRRGAVINLSSIAAFQATPYMSTYGATKAFVQSFSEGLWGEYRNRGLRVLAVCPGPVDTGFFEASGKPETRAGIPRRMMLKPAKVVEESLVALAANRMIVVPGGMGQGLIAGLPRLAPRQWVTAGLAGVLGRSAKGASKVN